MMQEALREHGLRSIRGRVVHTLQEVRDWWKELSVSHVVLKPVAGAGTAGLHFCNSEEEAVRAAETEFAGADYFGRKDGGLIMQERIEGTEYIINTVSRNGVHRITDIWVYDKVRRGRAAMPIIMPGFSAGWRPATRKWRNMPIGFWTRWISGTVRAMENTC